MENLILKYGEGVEFLSLDVEGDNYHLFSLIPDNFLKQIRCICIEHDDRHTEILARLIPFGFSELHRNGENLIIGKI